MATTKQLVRSALLGAFVFAGKWVLSGLPNIHPVALLVLIYTVCLGARSALAATAVYVMLEGLFYGFGDWWLAYCWAWPLWVLAVRALRRNDSALLWAVAAGFFGLFSRCCFCRSTWWNSALWARWHALCPVFRSVWRTVRAILSLCWRCTTP